MKKDILISLIERAGLPLIDVRDDIKSRFKDSKASEFRGPYRIIGNDQNAKMTSLFKQSHCWQ